MGESEKGWAWESNVKKKCGRDIETNDNVVLCAKKKTNCADAKNNWDLTWTLIIATVWR